MEVHKYARQRASRRPGSNGCVIMRGRRAQSPETIIVCARVHLGVWLCDRPAATGTGHRAPPAAMRPWGVAGRHVDVYRPRPPSAVLGDRCFSAGVSVWAAPAPPIRKPIKNHAKRANTKHESRYVTSPCTHS